MCGIIGYTGVNEAKDILLSGLKVLEYRGYDSAGIAVTDRKRSEPVISKCAGRVEDLVHLCDKEAISGTCGIGHTRWATHGGVTDGNAHPHKSGNVTLIHNGIIENYLELIQKYGLKDRLISETDSEVVAAILDFHYKSDPLEAILHTVKELKGTFALAMLFADHPNKIYAVRNVSPIIAAHCERGSFLASDVTAVCDYTCSYFVVPEYHIVELDRDDIRLFGQDLKEVKPDYLTLDWDVRRSGKNGYPFFMEKEILEQPDVIADTILPRITGELPDFTIDRIPDSLFAKCSHICIIGCGTAMHAGLAAKSLMQSLLGVRVCVELASEFTYSDPVLDPETLVIAISQSGETIDTLEALKLARRSGARNLSILNVRGSTIARESEYVLLTHAGPEIAVASTKAYTTQLAALYLIACKMAMVRGIFAEDEAKQFIRELLKVSDAVNKVLDDRDHIHQLAKNIVMSKDVFMIGRGLDYATILEGSLKLKEITYIHSEAYSSGELKHGTIALITKNTPVIALISQSRLSAKEISNAVEVRSRGAYMILVVREDLPMKNEEDWDVIYRIPELKDAFMIFPAVVFLQLLAYYTALDKGLDVDKPRNLAKVVTVE